MITATISREIVKVYEEAFVILESKIKCFLKGTNIEEEYIFKIASDYHTEYGPAMIAVAKVGEKRYAVYTPEYLTEEQKRVIYQVFLRDADSNDYLVVFTKRDYDAIKETISINKREVNYKLID